MPITFGTNIHALQAQQQLSKTGQELSSVFERLSSGQRINRASDDVAGLAIAESLQTDRRVYNQAMRNVNDGVSLLNIADSTLTELTSILTRIQELAEQASNGTFSSTQRQALDTEAQSLKDEFFRISRTSTFNGTNLFDGSFDGGIRVQAGYGIDGSVFSSLGGIMADGTFSTATTLANGGRKPMDVALGDLNGDGILDLVDVTYQGSDTLVRLGNGDGTFGAISTFQAGFGSSTVELADFNNDGILDAAISIANETPIGSASLGVVLFGNGDGTFGAAQTLAVGYRSRDFAIGDVNGDGALDIVATNRDAPNDLIILGNGDGTFGAAQTIITASSFGGIELGDVDGDGALDLVAISTSNDKAIVLLGNGDGTFNGSKTYRVGDGPQDVKVADLNGDGILDIFTSNAFGGDTTVLLGIGDGTFGSATTFQGGAASQKVQLADINSDGALDAVLNFEGADEVLTLFGNGDGTFGSAVTYGVGDRPKGIALGDLDGDGVLDFVTANNGSYDSSILLGGTKEGIAPILEFSLGTQADAIQAIAPLQRKRDAISVQHGVVGSFQSRLNHAFNNLSRLSENYSTAESRIRDADIAEETARMTRLNVLQDAATAILAQANLESSVVLSLLGKS